MMGGEEGKLLAGAAGFYSPWGSERKNRPRCILRRDFFSWGRKETLRTVRRYLPSASLPSGWERKEWILL